MNPNLKPTESQSQIESGRNFLRLIALGLIVIFACLAFSLFGCSKAPEDMIFDSVQQCASSGAYTLDECQTKFAAAQTDYQSNAPKFNSKAQCEAQFGSGNCETRQSAGGNGDFFLPFMMGYMMSGGFNSYPVYRSYGGGYSTYDTVHHTTTVINKTVVVNPTKVAPVTTAARAAASSRSVTTSVATPNATTKLSPVTTAPVTTAPVTTAPVTKAAPVTTAPVTRVAPPVSRPVTVPNVSRPSTGGATRR